MLNLTAIRAANSYKETVTSEFSMEEKTMAVKIRLRRMGQKKAPFYRIIVADSRSPRDGRFIEEIGTYDPSTDPSTFKINEELAKKWLANGAQPTEQVGKLFKAAGIEK
jgi:small subunit ribosomal protein S16